MTKKRDYNRLRPTVVIPPSNEQLIASLVFELDKHHATLDALHGEIDSILPVRADNLIVAEGLLDRLDALENELNLLALTIARMSKQLVQALKDQKRGLN